MKKEGEGERSMKTKHKERAFLRGFPISFHYLCNKAAKEITSEIPQRVNMPRSGFHFNLQLLKGVVSNGKDVSKI